MKIRNLILIAISCTTLIFSSCNKEEMKSSPETEKTLQSDVHSDIEWAIGWMEDGITYHFSINKAGELEVTELEGPPTLPQQEIVCFSGGHSFVNCVKDYLDGHPNGCVKLYKEGDNYVASDDC